MYNSSFKGHEHLLFALTSRVDVNLNVILNSAHKCGVRENKTLVTHMHNH